MKPERPETIMHSNTWRLATTALASLLACAAGCQFPDFHGLRDAAQNATSGRDVERLSERQIANVQLSLARSLEQEGDASRALDAYRAVAEKDPRQATAYWRMAVLHDRQGRTRESEALYRQALKLEPKNADMHCDLGYSLYLQRRWGESEECLRHAVALKSSHRRAHNNLGLLLGQTERVDEALAEFHKAGCPDAEAHANLAFVMTLNHRWDTARQQYELALDANPDSAAAKTGLENLNALIAKTSPNSGPLSLASYERSADNRPAAATPLAEIDRPEHGVIRTADRAP